MQPAKLWQSEHWHRKEFWRGKSLGLLCPWPTTAAPMSESLLSRCQSFKATKPFDCAPVWTLCTLYTHGEEYPTEAWLCPALPTCSRAPCSSIFTSELAFSSASPPVHHQYYYTIVLSARNVFRTTLNRFAMQCWFSTALLGWLLGSDVSKEVSLNKSLSTLLSVRSSNRFNRKN